MTTLKAKVAATVGTGDDTRDGELAELAVDQALAYAPEAPASAVREAAIRTAGWLRDVAPGLASTSIDGDSVEYRPAHGSALRGSGGMALLTTYRRRRARGGF